MPYANALFLTAFALSAVLQFNDPDPWLWVGFYSLAAMACALYGMKQLHWQTPMGLGCIALVWGLSMLPEFLGQVDASEIFASMTMQTEAIEEARESGGALVVAAWMLFLGFHLRQSSSRENQV